MRVLGAKQNDDVMAEINITPFTDVLLVLLIIFMILASLVTPPGFQMQLPGPQPPASFRNDRPERFIDVEVDARGTIFVDNVKTGDRGIYAAFASDVRKRGRIHVSITADAKAPYRTIIRILDAAREQRLEDIGFVTS